MVRSIFALAAVLAVASASLAGNLVTPPAAVGSTTTAFCRLANITSATIPAQLELWEAGGGILSKSGPITVLPGKTTSIDFVNPQVPVYCRFVNASKSKVRADLAASGATSDGTDQLVVPAQ
jgi:hypothetical protein